MNVLLVDDDSTLRMTTRFVLETFGHKVFEACDGQDALEKVRSNQKFEVVILDVNMPRMDGLEALQKIKETDPQVFCLVLTAYSNIKDAVKSIKYGAYDYLEKPVSPEKLKSVLEQAEGAGELVKKMAYSAPQLKFDQGRSIVGSSREIKKVFDIITKLSRVNTSVMIRGESGTGKELVARAIHFNSERKNAAFIPVNCAALPESLIESELFGHEKGSFTGADKRKAGRFELARGGTLFLDEIADISQAVQVKLLRVLQEKVFTPIGSSKEISADLRVITATHRPLEEMIEKGEFRADLFYRLNVLPIELPSLRERKDDIPPIIDFMLQKFNKAHQRNIQTITKDALYCLCEYKWPGNIRELENIIERAYILSSEDQIDLSCLPDELKVQQKSDSHSESKVQIQEPNKQTSTDLNYPELKEKFEKDFIVKALSLYQGRINRTALHTKMTKVTLLRKLEKYQINPRDFYPH